MIYCEETVIDFIRTIAGTFAKYRGGGGGGRKIIIVTALLHSYSSYYSKAFGMCGKFIPINLIGVHSYFLKVRIKFRPIHSCHTFKHVFPARFLRFSHEVLEIFQRGS